MINHKLGFSLAELLITLAILGVIACFTVPKVFTNQDLSYKQTNMARAAARMIVNAFEAYKNSVAVMPTSTSSSSLTPYMNYLSIDTTSYVDAHPNWGGTSGSGRNQCSVSEPCLILHNGGRLLLRGYSVGTNPNNVLEFALDPDNQVAGNANDGPSKSIQFELSLQGKLSTRGTVSSSACTQDYCGGLGPGPFDPSWFTGF